MPLILILKLGKHALALDKDNDTIMSNFPSLIIT